MSRRPAAPASLACALLLVSSLCGCGAGRDATTPGAGTSSQASPSSATGGAPMEAPSLRTGMELLRQGDLKGAEPHLTGALRSSPNDRRILEALGSIYARTDRDRQAEDSFRAALRVEPSSLGAQLGLAAVLIDTGRYDEAAGLLAELQKRAPENPVVRLKGALLDVRRGRAQEAETGARAAVGRQPQNPEAHYVLGLALEQRGALREAVEEMRRVHDLAPSHRGALSHLVTLETRLGDRQEAERWRSLQQEALDRAHVEDRVRDHRIVGVAAFNREDYRTALAEFQAIAAVDPRDAQVHLHLGSTYIGLGDLEQAKRELALSLSLDPRSDRAYAELGRAEAKTNRLDAAIEAFRKAIAINPQLAEPHYYLAGVYMARGEPERSREEMKIFQELQSRSQGAAIEVQSGDRP